MKRLLMALVVATVLMASSAQAADGGLYVSGNLAVGILTDAKDGGNAVSFDPGGGFAAAMGKDLGNIRVEGEISYRSYDIDTITISGSGTFTSNADVSFLSFMGNGYYDFEIGSPVTPYAGFGLGFTNWEIASVSSTELAYQLMFGAAYAISSQAALTAGYRFWGFTDNDGSFVHEVNLGARFYF